LKFANFSSESGSVVLEFVGFGLLLQVTLLLVILNLGALQHDQLAAEAISRDSLRAFLLIGKPPSATAAEIAKAYRVNLGRLTVTLICQADDCDAEGNRVTVVTRIGSVQSEEVGLR
jgi:hypothetical protein